MLSLELREGADVFTPCKELVPTKVKLEGAASDRSGKLPSRFGLSEY